jgi:hypothetical protein
MIGLGRLFRRSEPHLERRGLTAGFTAEVMAARESYISGRRGLAELTATVQACVSLWENGFALAQVEGAPQLDRRTMALLGRALALRGEALFLVDEARLVPAAEWDLSTRHGEPRAYRLSISEAGGGRSLTVLAAEVLHVRIGSDPAAPWTGTAPLRRAALTAGLLHELEAALAEIYGNAPIGSQIVPMPETPGVDLEKLGRGFRGRRGAVLLRESVNVSAAGGPAPVTDWRPSDTTPNLAQAMTVEHVGAAREAIAAVFGVLPGLLAAGAAGPTIREAQRHLATWQLQPIAELLAEEAGAKLGGEVTIDTLTPAQAFDAGGHARAVATIVSAMVEAKAGGLTPAEIAAAFGALDWGEVTQK